MRLRSVLPLLLTASLTAFAQTAPLQEPVSNDIPATFTPPVAPPTLTMPTAFNYTKRIAMIPMRDGTRLYTVILIPKGATHAPIVLTRTCYNAAGRAHAARTPMATGAPAPPPAAPGTVHPDSPHMMDELGLPDEIFVEAGYIRIYQDVRGKYGSEGVYLMTPPPVGPYNPTGADDTTDAYDTIDWLVKNVPESNGKVGMIGSSYEGFTVVMALLHPHPALKVAAPESPMIDGWMGDDWFHYGAFRQNNLDYFVGQTARRGEGFHPSHGGTDDYTNFLVHGSTGDMARFLGEDQLPYWRTVEQHPAYDGFWQSQALDHLIAKLPLTVPTMWLQGLWDQEDMWGGNHSYAALEPKDTTNTLNYLVMGPWFHSQVNREGRNLGPLVWGTDTTAEFRREVLLPFFNQYLQDDGPVAKTPPVLIYNTGEDHWDRLQSWPLSCASGCPAKSRPLYLSAASTLSFTAPTAGKSEASKFDQYTSDPAKPVPYSPRPVDGANWRTWLVTDQRFVDGRTDILTYETEPLTAPVRLAGVPVANLYASTTGTDSDWVIKLIDVYPPDATPATFSGYELPISTDIFRGRYRTSFEHPEAIKPNEPLLYKFDLPNVNHVFQPGHRIMVQVQSTLFPLYDRNPQTFVPNIFDAKPTDYHSAEQRIWHTPQSASFIDLPILP